MENATDISRMNAFQAPIQADIPRKFEDIHGEWTVHKFNCVWETLFDILCLQVFLKLINRAYQFLFISRNIELTWKEKYTLKWQKKQFGKYLIDFRIESIKIRKSS